MREHVCRCHKDEIDHEHGNHATRMDTDTEPTHQSDHGPDTEPNHVHIDFGSSFAENYE